MEQFRQSVNYLDAALSRIADVRYRAASQELIGLSYLMQKQWLEADNIFNGLQESDVAEVRKTQHYIIITQCRGRNCLAAVHF